MKTNEMKNNSFIFYVNIIILLLVFDSSDSVVLRDTGIINKSNNEQGLYSPEDEVEILTFENFNSSIYGSQRAWMIEFYSNWCGHCRRSVPIYIALAIDVKNWNDLVGVGALDCANENNAPVCTNYGITKYPTFKYFHEFFQHGENMDIQLKVDSHTNVSEHRRNLVAVMVKEQSEGRGKIFPNLKPFNNTDVSKIFETEQGNPIYAFLIIQKPYDDVGASITMDFHKVKDVVVRYSYDAKFNKDVVHALYVLKKGDTLELLHIPTADRQGVQMKISQYLMSKNVTVPNFDNNLNLGQDSSDSSSINSKDELELGKKIKKMGDVVFQVDLENALRWSLKQEVGRVKEVTSEKLDALKKYVTILEKYFPFGENGKKLLSDIKNYVFSNNTVKGTHISKLVKDAEHPGQVVFSSSQQWLACRGSSPHFRGYPCGIWKLFHYLTVNVFNRESVKKSTNPRVVLIAMHGYIKHFFGCWECSNHFQEMSEKRNLTKVASWDESILWLWKAHNEVNDRLSGDATEDPEYPKVQFPTKNNCARCRDDNNLWNEGEVLSYLQTMYSNENINYLYADTQVLNLDISSADSKILPTSMHLTVAACLVSWTLSRD